MKLFVLLITASAAFASDAAIERLQAEIARAAKISGGVTGVAARHIESGKQVLVSASEGYPMASTFKIPIAVTLLEKVDRGEISLAQMVELRPQDIHPGSGTITPLLNKPGVLLSVRNLLELMLLISDNSATDILLRLAGGPAAVTAKMKAVGAGGIRVDRSCAQLISDAVGAELPGENSWTPDLWNRLYSSVSNERRREAAAAFEKDPRDTATPASMMALLEKIHRKELHKPETAELLLDILHRCQTGEARIKGLLPPGTAVAHKTGTLNGIGGSGLATNDVGIVTLPDGAGHVALAIFVKFAPKTNAAAEQTIAHAARAVYDYFLYTTAPQASALNYGKLADRIVASLKPAAGERVVMRFDPGYFREISAPLRAKLEAAGAKVTELEHRDIGAKGTSALPPMLAAADVYLWMPFRDSVKEVPAEESEALKKWLDAGGSHREIHFHWPGGSVAADGLPVRHPAAYDQLYEDAIDIDYKALSEAQDAVISTLRFGTIRIRTPAGTDLLMRIEKRPVNKQDGDASAARMKQARVRVDREIELPAGVVRVAPVEGTVGGTLVIPEGRFGGVTAKNVRFEIAGGRVTRVTASEGEAAVKEYLAAGGPAAMRFREIGIGVNPKLTVQRGAEALPYYGYGAGVVRASLGDNEEIGGDVRGGFVRWFFLTGATVDLYGKPLIKDGKLLVE